jgi:hypothetical protein
MLDTEGFITKIRNIIADNTTLALTDVYTPELPSEKTNICAVTLLTGNNRYNLCGNEYFDLTFRVIIRGTINDTTTRALVDDIYNSLNMQGNVSFNTSTIVQILAETTPIYVGKDENNNNVYNITFRSVLKGE